MFILVLQLTHLVTGLKKLTPLSQQIRSKANTKHDLLTQVSYIVGCLHLIVQLQVLIGPIDCFASFVIGQILALVQDTQLKTAIFEKLK